MEQGMISIIVPVYKVEQYLDNCISSIVSQTYNKIEIILVDDGSPDSCGEICEKWKLKDDRITVIHQNNQGLSAARNSGIAISRGEYLLFVDSDDWIDINLCNNILADLIRTNADIVVFGYAKVDELNHIVSMNCCLSEEIIDSKEGLLRLITGGIDNYAWNKLYKRQLFDELQYPVGKQWEDIGTTYKVFINAKIICLSNRILYYYLVRSGSITAKPSPRAVLDVFEQRYEQFCILQEKYPDLAAEQIPFLGFAAIELCDKMGKCDQSAVAIKVLNGLRGKYSLENPKIKMFWANNDVFFLLFYLLNKNRKVAANLIDIAKRTKKALKPVLHPVYLLSQRLNSHEIVDMNDENGIARIFIIGTPDHDNLGDHAIAIAIEEYIKNIIGLKNAIYSISELQYWKVRKFLIENIKQHDILILQGGGNIGNQYTYIEDIRRDTIQTFKNNIKIVFPQTIFFSDDAIGRKEQKITQKIYTRSKNLILFAREQFSYNKMKELFQNKVYLAPDIVLSLPIQKYDFVRQGILLCLRSDHEANISLSERKLILEAARRITSNINDTDTCIGGSHSGDEAKEKIKKKLSQFAQSQVVITDRLHGMVFAALTNTPCVAISNYNKKIAGIYKWIYKLDYVKFVENIDEISDALDKVLLADKNFLTVFGDLRHYYEDLRICLVNANQQTHER